MHWISTELIQLTNQPKTAGEVTVNSVVPNAGSGTRVTREVVPRPTPQNTGRAGRWSRWIFFGRLLVVILSVIIVAPFEYIAVHVVQPKRVRLFQFNLMSIPLINIPSVFSIPSVITKILNSLRKLQSWQPPGCGTKSFGFHATTLQH